MKKLLFVITLGLLLVSCSKEELETSQNNEVALKSFSSTDISYLGTYKGLYAELGSSKRGTVEITINETSANALLRFVDGSETLLTGTGSTSLSGLKTFSFNAPEGSFDFSVSATGSSPTVSAVNLEGAEGSILIAKDVTATPVRLATGTFGCDDCGGHPILSDENMQASFVWNAMFIGEGIEESVVGIQVSFGEAIFLTAGNLYDHYDKVGLLVYNDMDGEFEFGAEGMITWEATQMYSLDGACVDIRGRWSMSTPSYEKIKGWLKSDSSCNPL